MTPDRLTVHEFGDPAGPALVLVHGLTEAGTAWPDAVERWQAHWHIVAPDLRGHGSSPRFLQHELVNAMDVLSDDLLGLLLQVGPSIVIGHSLGGRVALGAALRAPEQVTALVLEDPAITDWDRAPDDFVAEQERLLDAYAVDDGAHQRALLRRDSSWSDAEIDACAHCKPQVDRGLVRDLHMGWIDRVQALDALAVPTLLVAPRGSPLMPDPGHITNPSVRIEIIDDAGHCVRRDNAAAYHRAVDPFLAQHR